MIKIYCEDGAVTKEVREIGKSTKFTLISFPFENRNQRTTDATRPSHPTADSTFWTADNTRIKIGNTSFSEISNEVKDIIGLENFNDIRHFDAAYKEGAKIFITPDKKDIASKADSLFKISRIKVFHCDNITEIKKYCSELIEKL